jgi:hypothetical protein
MQARKVPVFIICRDRVESLRQLVAWLERAGCDDLHLVDNASTYPPMLEYLEQTPHDVIRLDENLGAFALWRSVLPERGVEDRFVCSDPDIVPIEECPLDAIDYFGEILDRYPRAVKAGFGLRIDDIPDHYAMKDEVAVIERYNWERPIAPRLYEGFIDTTFALYRGLEDAFTIEPAIRTGYPYLARHTTWYLDENDLPEEERHYRANSTRTPWWSRDTVPQKLNRLAGALQDRAVSAQGEVPGAWEQEPDPVDETAFTAWAEPGWSSWNPTSPEVEFCDLAATLVQATRPRIVMETGTGAGFLARRLARALGREQLLVSFEADDSMRGALAALPFYADSAHRLAPEATPNPVEIVRADLTVLDSEPEVRLRELEAWTESARPGAVLLVHDAGNGHPADSFQDSIAQKIADLGVPGTFLSNPRGGFLGVKPGGPGRPVPAGEEPI